MVEVWGAGGGGGNNSLTTQGYTSGGGGGGYGIPPGPHSFSFFASKGNTKCSPRCKELLSEVEAPLHASFT